MPTNNNGVTDAERLTAYLSASSDVRYRMSPDWSEMHQLDGKHFLADTVTATDRWLIDYIHPDDRPHVREVIDTAIRTKSVFELEHRVRRADGSWGWTLSRAVPILDAHGEIKEWFGAASDVTARREGEARLRESEERLRQFGEHSPDTLWIIDAKGDRLEYLSAAYERMWGEPRERVMNDLDHWREHVHPDDREMVAAGMPSLLAGERQSIEYRIVRPDGEVRWIFDTGFPIRDDTGRVTRIAGVAQDLTARREAEDRVRESERRFRSLSEGVPQLIWRAVDHGHWSWASPQWTGFTGQAEADSHGWGWLGMVHPHDREAARAAWDRAIATGGFEVEYRVLRADGRYRWFSTRATPVHDDEGNLIEWLGTSNDIDDLRRLQKHQQLLLGELQHRVRNSLAVVRSIARRTAATSDTVEGFSMHLDGRLGAFARMQAAVTRDPSNGIDLHSIVVDELSAHAAREGEQIHVDGPDIRLQPKAGETIALAIHELATNAVKYGALSVPDGVVRVTWDVTPGSDGEDRLTIAWAETRPGPPAPLPTRRGFGTELLETTLEYELEAETDLDFDPGGLRCTIRIPLTADIGKQA